MRTIVVKKMTEPTDVAACSKTGHLYVADRGTGQCLWRIKKDDTLSADENIAAVGARKDKPNYTVTKWKQTEHPPWSLSVTKQGAVLVVDYNGKLTVYSGDGELAMVIPLKDVGLEGPRHAIQTQDRTYIVCHGIGVAAFHRYMYARQSNALNRVCEIDPNGKILKECGGPSGYNAGQLYIPCHIAQGADDREKFLVDHRRVFVLNERLEINVSCSVVRRTWLT